MLQDENMRLKTNLQKLQQDNEKNEKLICSMLTPSSLNLKADTYLVQQLKRQIRELKQTLRLKDTEIGELKRNVKVAKMRENDSDIQVF